MVISTSSPEISVFSKSVMVSVAVSTLGRSHLVFIDPGVKINGAYYRDVLLSQHLPVIRNIAPEGCFVFKRTVPQPRKPS